MKLIPKHLLFSVILGAICLYSACSREKGQNIAIHIWYGQDQCFGKWGNPQRQINILGNIQGLDDSCRVFYTLNGTDFKEDITLGSDLHRLAMDGDFNIDIQRSELLEGENFIDIIIERKGKKILSRNLNFHYSSDKQWPIPYFVDWSQAEKLQDVVEVVDGHWEITPSGVHIRQQYYDRILAFGDSSWLNYEVETSVVFHDYIPPVEGPPTYNVSHVAIASRWPGHDHDSLQPDRKWFPLGATSEFRITDFYDSCRWRIFDGENFYMEQLPEDYRTIQAEQVYRLKHRVENISDSVVLYSVKFWHADENEPEQWDLQATERMTSKECGSALLLAHNTDVTFGNISVVAVD